MTPCQRAMPEKNVPCSSDALCTGTMTSQCLSVCVAPRVMQQQMTAHQRAAQRSCMLCPLENNILLEAHTLLSTISSCSLYIQWHTTLEAAMMS